LSQGGWDGEIMKNPGYQKIRTLFKRIRLSKAQEVKP
jgi:hypothetical protein